MNEALNHIFNMALYIFCGFVYDLITVKYYLAVNTNKLFLATSLSFIWTVFSYALYYRLILGPDFVINVMTYGIGCALGTWYTMVHHNYNAEVEQHL